jgi:hypothetical protein
MNDSQYEDALVALRDVGAPSPERAAATRAAILRAMTPSAAPIAAPRRRRPVAAALLLAAALGGTAFASNTVARWRARAEPVSATSSSQHRAPVAQPAARPSLSLAPTAASAAPPSTVPSIAPSSPSPAPSPARPTITAARPVARRAVVAAAPPVMPAPSSDALYTAAHEAHFSQRDYGSALARWDAYIAAAPQGHFVPEAQFNRIVCLVRLGRREDAIASIRALPLAHYRRVEADRLLDRLAATP